MARQSRPGCGQTIKLWHVKSGTEIRMLTGHNGEVKALAFSPDGKQLLSGSKDGTIKTWDVGKTEVTRTLSGYSNEINSIAFTPGGQWFASGSDDGSTRIWDSRTGDAMATLISLRECRRLIGPANGLARRVARWSFRWLAKRVEPDTVAF